MPGTSKIRHASSMIRIVFGGIISGFAPELVELLGAIGYEGRWDYACIGSVTNLAARLCSDAKGGQILTNQKTLARVEDLLNEFQRAGGGKVASDVLCRDVLGSISPIIAISIVDKTTGFTKRSSPLFERVINFAAGLSSFTR